MGAISNLEKLPPTCLGVLNGQVVTITRGAAEALPCHGSAGMVDTINKQNGVSVYQRRAMENGILFGWAGPAADPDRVAGEQVVHFQKYTVATPYVKIVTVLASNEEDALRLAGDASGDLRKDGPAMITEIEDGQEG